MAKVLVGKGDQVQIRYPTPSTWNTQTTVQVQIGTGLDPTDVTFGTRIPDATVDPFTFVNQNGTNELNQAVQTFEKDSFYYSNTILLNGIEIVIPANISVTTSGPQNPNVGGRDLTGNQSFAAFEVNSSGTWVTTANVQNGDTIRLRVKTEKWYTTTTNVELTVGDETFGTSIGEASTRVIDTWSITTRDQKQSIGPIVFTDFVDVLEAELGTYKSVTLDTDLIDDDCVLRATATEDGEVSKDGINWTQDLRNVVLGDTIYTRVAIGTWTEKTETDVRVYAVPSETYDDGNGNYYDNNEAGTYGRPDLNVSRQYSVIQETGDEQDDWNVWTEVKRYPDPVECKPIYIISDGDEVVVSSQNVYNYANVSIEDELDEIVYGYYYADLPISGLGVEYVGGAYLDLEQPLDITRSGFINLQPTGPIKDNFAVGGNDPNNLNDVYVLARVSGGNADIRNKNVGGPWVQSMYVKNGDLITIRQRSPLTYNTSFTSTLLFEGPPFGGPNGNPTEGPDVANRSRPDVTDTITIKNRQARVTPYPFKSSNTYNALPGEVVITTFEVVGIDEPVTVNITDSSPASGAQISKDGSTFNGNNIPNVVEGDTIQVKMVASTTLGSYVYATIQIGTRSDTVYLYTGKENYDYVTYKNAGDISAPLVVNVPTYAQNVDFVVTGAGGGNGGDDAPQSFGGAGAAGNEMRGTLTLPVSYLIANNQLNLYLGAAGQDGVTFTASASGGNGGWGYDTGGNGGDAGPGDRSGSGGGGGGATAIALVDGTVLVLAGGGAGGAGAGNDTEVPPDNMHGNYLTQGSLRNSLSGIGAEDADDNPSQGGGPGGGGGGWGTAGSLLTTRDDAFGVEVQTDDLDTTAGQGGGAYYDNTYVTLAGNLGLDIVGGETVPPQQGAASGDGGFILLGFPPQDRDPEPVTFNTLTGQTPNTTVDSNIVQVRGITGLVLVTVAENDCQVRVYDTDGVTLISDWDSPSVLVANEQWIQLRMTTGLDYYSKYVSTIDIGIKRFTWEVETGEPPDTLPNPFEIPPVNDVEPSTTTDPNLIVSEPILISGINTAVEIYTVGGTGAELAICGPVDTCSAFTAAGIGNPLYISNNQYFKVRLPASEDYQTTVSTTVQVGSTPVSPPKKFEVRTMDEPDITPDNFFFFPLEDQPLDLLVTSINSVTIRGIDSTTFFRVTRDDGGTPNATIILNGDQTGLSEVTVQQNDVIKLEYQTSDILGDSVDFTIECGTYTTQWQVSNEGNFGVNPDPFLFTDVFAEPLQYGESNEIILVNGINVAVPIYGTNGIQFDIGLTGTYSTIDVLDAVTITAGQQFRVRLLASAVAGFDTSGIVTVGSYQTPFTVFANSPVQDPIRGQWYSSIQTIKPGGDGQIRFSTKFEGLPIGTIMPVFQDSTAVNKDGLADNWGVLDGKADSRFHGWVYCDGRYVNKLDYPLLFEVLDFDYGATTADPNLFKVPDMRNRRIVGTGPIDGNSSSSPILNPLYGPAKSSINASGNIPGSQGGQWFINTIGDPGVDTQGDNNEFEQVITPPDGQPAQQSPFFTIANVRTEGYSNVQGAVEFQATGQMGGVISIGQAQIRDIPRHFHDLVSGAPDPSRNKGYVQWGRSGAYSNQAIELTSKAGEDGPSIVTDVTRINIWGYATGDYLIQNPDNVPRTDISSNDDGNIPIFAKSSKEWSSDSGFVGEYIDDKYSSLTVEQPNIEKDGSNYNEIASYINLETWSGGSSNSSGSSYRFIGAVDVPEKFIQVQAYRPTRAKHSHYISLNDPGDPDQTFSWGKDDGAGVMTAGSTFATTEVDMRFDSFEVGMEILPGTFVLNQTKQLIPVPELSPKDKVPLIAPYSYVHWMIKAF